MSVNRSTGKRSYSANTYLTAAVNRSNFFVLLGAQATKLNIKGRTVQSVTYIVDGKLYTASVNNEVILSAGMFRSLPV